MSEPRNWITGGSGGSGPIKASDSASRQRDLDEAVRLLREVHENGDISGVTLFCSCTQWRSPDDVADCDIAAFLARFEKKEER